MNTIITPDSADGEAGRHKRAAVWAAFRHFLFVLAV